MHEQNLNYERLFTSFKKGLGNGNWRKLNFLDKALYRAAMWYAKHHYIVNALLVEKLLGLIEKLKETKGMRIFKRGFDKAVELLGKSKENGVFVWAPRLKDWLRDPDYIFWLGMGRF
ncbi:MAG: hypothetical protein QMD22_10915 [archaeon]|nr:hypothetical protein [archaeon]